MTPKLHRIKVRFVIEPLCETSTDPEYYQCMVPDVPASESCVLFQYTCTICPVIGRAHFNLIIYAVTSTRGSYVTYVT